MKLNRKMIIKWLEQNAYDRSTNTISLKGLNLKDYNVDLSHLQCRNLEINKINTDEVFMDKIKTRHITMRDGEVKHSVNIKRLETTSVFADKSKIQFLQMEGATFENIHMDNSNLNSITARNCQINKLDLYKTLVRKQANMTSVNFKCNIALKGAKFTSLDLAYSKGELTGLPERKREFNPEEKRQFLIDNFYNAEYNRIELHYLDLSDYWVHMAGLRAERIDLQFANVPKIQMRNVNVSEFDIRRSEFECVYADNVEIDVFCKTDNETTDKLIMSLENSRGKNGWLDYYKELEYNE
jgi:uncharacterized protein YjbI with pentapeptide repeats